ncbi:hypothetical protein DFH08DRAFT_951541 [Mycena albidolilacea]|uniref:Ribonuclease H1 N-terminal domain-containing protein n=1 Tax=Mycena albidolilacea TaxID=1033008 RepID=A0AAD7AJT2_9AGAR|nr:hypothetical protein DFH08DRAFT_951541 [Mycena albidolilacea]
MSSPTSPYRCNPPYYPHPGEPNTLLARRKLYLVCSRRVKKPGMYTSWASADAQYKHVPGATVKGYRDYNELKAAWHSRCDLGEHNHPAALSSHSPSPASASPTDDDSPAYSAIFETQSAPSVSPPLAGEHMGRSHEGPRAARSRR